MDCRIDVVVPGPWWTPLTYAAERPLPIGARVRVPLGRGTRVGFVLGPAEGKTPPKNLRTVAELLDEGNVLGGDLWDLARWMGRAFLCGTGQALQTICPGELLRGEPAPSADGPESSGAVLRESSCFDPRDEVRTELYMRRLEQGGRTLLLFPERRMARAFFDRLPPGIRAEAVLWPSTGGKRLWRAWREVREGLFRIVVGGPGGVFAPLAPEMIIVDDESNPGYIAQRPPRASARSLAGHRAARLGAELFLGGRMPSSKTFLRTSPQCCVLPERRCLVFADMRRSLAVEARGVEGTLPLTVSLLERTRTVLGEGRNALWILDRRGEAAEVYCSDCGNPVTCPRCGGIMRAEGNGGMRCVRCGAGEPLERLCSVCRGALWMGRRPGLEALAEIAGRLIRGYPVLPSEAAGHGKGSGASLILGTRGALALCDTLDVGLTAWLDLEAELRRPEYGARFQVFSMLWESCWRGRPARAARERLVLVQSRRSGAVWRDVLARGWGGFWRDELDNRRELGLPPFGVLVQIEPSPGGDRGELLRTLEDAGFFVMDPGEPDLPLWVSAATTEALWQVLAPRFGIGHSREGFPTVTVWAE